MKTWCFYHTDLDGFTSGAIIRYFEPEVVMYPIDYGQPFPWHKIESDDIVYMADFSLAPFENMENLYYNCKKLIWIDHHHEIIQDYKKSKLYKKIDGIQESGIGACVLCWEYFTEIVEKGSWQAIPEAVQMAGEYDVRNHLNIKTVPFFYGMEARHADPEDSIKFNRLWKKLFENPYERNVETKQNLIDEIVDDGRAIHRYVKKFYKKYSDVYSFFCYFEDMRVLCVNIALTGSLILEHLFNPKKHDCMMTFAYNGQGWSVSMYGKGGNNLAKIAKKYGGGGHKEAAGFRVKSFKIKNGKLTAKV